MEVQKMNELNEYVNKLFSGTAKTRKTEDLKAEILGNLEAKRDDLLASGITEAVAIKQVEESITNVDFLIDGNKRVYINRMKLEFVQFCLIVVLVGWILTIPLLMFHIGLPANGILFFTVVGVGFYYLTLRQKLMHNETAMTQMGIVNVLQAKKRRNIVWLLWGIFAVLSFLATTAMYFGSNIWFSRKISINGPYALAGVLIAYFIPLLTVILPLLFSGWVKLINKYKAGDEDEN